MLRLGVGGVKLSEDRHVVNKLGPLYSDGRQYGLERWSDGCVEILIHGVVMASSYLVRSTHLIGDCYKEGVIEEAFANWEKYLNEGPVS